jgi:type I restriction enzyme, S subunit
MMMWKKEKLGDLLEYNPKIPLKKGDEYALIEMEEVTPSVRFITTSKTIHYEGNSGSKFANGDILFARISPCLENKKIGQAKIPTFQYGVGSTEFFVLRANEKNDHTFLFYLLKSDFIIDNAVNSMVGASGRQRADWEYIKKVKIPLPPLPTQRRIASILGNYDLLIANYEQQISTLEQSAKEIYKEWFVRGRCPYGKVEEWEKGKISDFCKYISRGVTPTYDDESNLFCINQKANKGSFIDYSEMKKLSEEQKISNENYAYKGDVLLNSLGEGTLGRIHFFFGESTKYVVDQHMTIIRAGNLGKSLYVYYYFSSELGISILESIKTGGTNMTMLNINYFRGLIVPMPNKMSLIKLEEIIIPIFQKIENLQSQIAVLKQTRDKLLPRLLSGEMSV